MGIKSFARKESVKMFSMSIWQVNEWQVHEQGALITILTMNIYARKLK